MPSETIVNLVRKQYEKRIISMEKHREFITNSSSHRTLADANELPQKKVCGRKFTLITEQNTSVFERLYAKRKQMNQKQLTDSEKLKLHLAKQKEEIKRVQAQRIKLRTNRPNNSRMEKTNSESATIIEETLRGSNDSGLDFAECTTPVNVCPKARKDYLNNQLKFGGSRLKNRCINFNNSLTTSICIS